MRNYILGTKGIRFGNVPGGLSVWMFSLALLLSSSLGLAGLAFSGAAAQKLTDRYAEENGLDAAPPDAAKVFLSRPQGSAGMLLIPESTNDRVMLFDAFDGSLINAAFITSAGELSTPINAIVANGEIWVSDQLTDDIIRYDLTTGALLGPLVNTGLDNIRGMDFINGTLFVTNAGTGNGAPGEAIVKFDSSGNNLGSFPSLGSPFDVFPRNSELLVADIDADRIQRFSTTGMNLGTFASGMDFPEQISRRSNGNYLIANFSGSTNDIVELDPNGGFVRAFDLVSGERGVFELGNGNFIYTNGNGVHILNPNDGTSTPVLTGVGARFIEAIPSQTAEGCTLTCPSDITVPNDLNQCGAVVNYSAPTVTGTCGSITCSPGTGSFFPVGTTTVNCSAPGCGSAFATTTTNELVTFDVTSPGTTSATAITGLVTGDQVVGIDFRPATGQLYALGVNEATAHLYTLNIATALATQVGGNISLPQSAGVTAGTEYGFDFNPTVDLIRVVANSRDNFRLNPDTGAVAGADTALTAGSNVVGAAYDRNFAGATQTTLFGIDSLTDMLVTIGGVNGVPSPNTGAVTNVGALGVNTSDLVGFDVTECATGFVALNVGGASQLYVINLSNGSVTVVGSIGSELQIRSLAIENTTATCSFNVTVEDTQPPTITCPANIIAVTNQNACPAPACQTVTFPLPTASDNCPGVTVVCNPPAGSCFPVGVTTVTCTATDASGNTATCSFTVTTFDTALQDDSNPAIILLWNSLTGEYRFCCNGTTYTGIGKSIVHGCVYTLQHYPPDRRVLAQVDKAVHAGHASIQFPVGTIRCTITDRDTLNDTLMPACQ